MRAAFQEFLEGRAQERRGPRLAYRLTRSWTRTTDCMVHSTSVTSGMEATVSPPCPGLSLSAGRRSRVCLPMPRVRAVGLVVGVISERCSDCAATRGIVAPRSLPRFCTSPTPRTHAMSAPPRVPIAASRCRQLGPWPISWAALSIWSLAGRILMRLGRQRSMPAQASSAVPVERCLMTSCGYLEFRDAAIAAQDWR